MSTADEASTWAGPLGSALEAGLEQIDQNQVITFTKYVRVVLPMDGFVFWVKADLLSNAALGNAAVPNSAFPNKPRTVITAAATIRAKGSLHYGSDRLQNEDETTTANRMVFTSETEVQAFNEIGPTVIFLATFRGIRFAFSRRGYFYQQASLWHYEGAAVYSSMASQIIDYPQQLDTQNTVVSNSLPAWLALNSYFPFYTTYFNNDRLPLYPSFAVPANLPPPFGSVHIVPETTRALQVIPFIDRQSNHWQLTTERVRVTMYGMRNFDALDFIDCVNQYTLDTDAFGITGSPAVVRDDKRTQPELDILAMKKTVEFEISYYQTATRNIARQLIVEAIPTYYVEGIKGAPVKVIFSPSLFFADARNSQYAVILGGV